MSTMGFLGLPLLRIKSHENLLQKHIKLAENCLWFSNKLLNQKNTCFLSSLELNALRNHVTSFNKEI